MEEGRGGDMRGGKRHLQTFIIPNEAKLRRFAEEAQ
jgi:hypothetical protein